METHVETNVETTWTIPRGHGGRSAACCVPSYAMAPGWLRGGHSSRQRGASTTGPGGGEIPRGDRAAATRKTAECPRGKCHSITLVS